MVSVAVTVCKDEPPKTNVYVRVVLTSAYDAEIHLETPVAARCTTSRIVPALKHLTNFAFWSSVKVPNAETSINK